MGTKLRIVSRPELVEIKGRMVSTSGWHHMMAEDHLVWHLTQQSKDKWCDIGCMTSHMFQRNTPRNAKATRRNIPPLFRQLLGRNRLLVIYYDNSKGGHGKIHTFKIFETNTGQERQYAYHQADRMAARMTLSQEARDHMLALIEAGSS